MYKTISIGLLMIFAISCSNNEDSKQSDEWANSSWQFLEQENIKIRLPDYLKRSSRYFLSKDLPALAQDTSKLRLVQNSLEMLEFEDAEIDVFVDTTKTYRLIIICNTQKIDFNKNDAALLRKQLQIRNKKQSEFQPNLEFGDLDVKLKRNSKLLLARYTTPIKNKIDQTTVFNSIYYLSGNSYTLVVYEFSENKDYIEKYLWSTTI